ncbi:MAG: hypothetical protein K9I94_10360 [Bacteroidales bacterium]|nr:hypothetical protein [Bacteroidales bacterium]
MNNKALKKRLRKVRSLKDIELEKQRMKYELLRTGQSTLNNVETVRDEFSSGRVFSYLFSYLIRFLFGTRYHFFRSFFDGFKYFFGGKSKRRKSHKGGQQST